MYNNIEILKKFKVVSYPTYGKGLSCDIYDIWVSYILYSDIFNI